MPLRNSYFFLTDPLGDEVAKNLETEESLDSLLNQTSKVQVGKEFLKKLKVSIGTNEFTSSKSTYTLSVYGLKGSNDHLLWIFISNGQLQENASLSLFQDSTFQKILESAPDATIIVDQKGKIRIANYQTSQVFGYSNDELIGMGVETLMPEKFRGNHGDHRNAYSKKPRFRSMGEGLELLGLRKTGNTFPVEISLSPILLEGKNMIAASIRDISSRKELENKEKELKKNLEAVNDELENFAYIVSHDLKAPLRSIGSLVEFIEEDEEGKLAKDSVKHFGMLKDQLEKMHGLIEGILQYSRVGRKNSEKQEIDSGKIIQDILNYYLNEQELDFELNGDFPKLNVNPTLFHQLFQNLISNAVKAIQNKTGRIAVSYQSIEDTHIFKVSDNGKGIDPKHHNRIFKIFQTLGDNDDGTGVGLTIVKKIVDHHEGDIQLESMVGLGTTFTISLPKKTT